MPQKIVRLRELPGMAAFLDAVAALLDTVNTERDQVPGTVVAAADRVRAEALAVGNDPGITVDEPEKSPARLANEQALGAAARVAKDNPGRAVNVDWLPEG